jgi:hypothetical protein
MWQLEQLTREIIQERTVVVTCRFYPIVRSVEALVGTELFESREGCFFLGSEMAEMTLETCAFRRGRRWR